MCYLDADNHHFVAMSLSIKVVKAILDSHNVLTVPFLYNNLLGVKSRSTIGHNLMQKSVSHANISAVT